MEFGPVAAGLAQGALGRGMSRRRVLSNGDQLMMGRGQRMSLQNGESVLGVRVNNSSGR